VVWSTLQQLVEDVEASLSCLLFHHTRLWREGGRRGEERGEGRQSGREGIRRRREKEGGREEDHNMSYLQITISEKTT